MSLRKSQIMTIPQGYKQTELGIIPEDWNIKSIGEFLSIGNGHDYKGKSFGNIPVYGTGGIITHIDDYLYDGQTICIGRKGTIDKPIFHSGKIWTVDTLYYTYNFIDIEVKFIYYLLLTIDWMSLNEATGVPSLTSDRIKQITLALPPIAEQRAIAEALSDVDGLIAALDKKIAKKRLLKQGAMQQLLTGKKRLPGFGPQTKSPAYKQTELGLIPEDWEVKRLGEICDLINGDRSSKYPKDDEMVSNGIPFINAGHLKEGAVDFDEMDYITRNHYQSLSGAKIREGDILFCLRGSLGKNALVVFNDGAPASSLCVIRHKTINEKLLFQIINSALFEKQIIDANSGSSQPNLSAKEVSIFLIPIPTSKEEQTAIANVLSSMDKEIETLNTKLEKYRNLKTAMMQQLLTGKIRL